MRLPSMQGEGGGGRYLKNSAAILKREKNVLFPKLKGILRNSVARNSTKFRGILDFCTKNLHFSENAIRAEQLS